MSNASQQSFVADHYASRAEQYVRSVNHSTGADLDEIETLLQGRGDARVLDLGCGGGHVSYRAAAHVREVVACDITASMLTAVLQEAARRGLDNIKVQQAAAEQLPFADASFDVVLCRFSAHHWGGMEAGLREARRVLQPGGQAGFIDVVAPADSLLDSHLQAFELLRDASHVRDYSVSEWVAALGRAGFAIRSMTAHKLRIDFAVWIARTSPPAEHVDVLRSLQRSAPAAVRSYFGIADDGGFDLDTTTFLADARTPA